MQNLSSKLANFKERFQQKIIDTVARTFELMAVIVLHAVTLPSLLAVMQGVTDKMPPVDLILLLWLGLTFLFAKAAIQRDLLIMITVGAGFVLQAVMMALIFFG